MPSLPKHNGKKVYWTKNRVLKVARKYKSKKKFRKESRVAYQKARDKGYLEEATEHMTSTVDYISKPPGFWDKKSNCLNVAKECKTYVEFRKKYPTAYSKVRKNSWTIEFRRIFSLPTRKPEGYYTFQKCWEIASTCRTKKEFENKNAYAYDKCRLNGWIDIVSLHMDQSRLPNHYWTKEKCLAHAKKYSTRTEFQKKSRKAYSAAVQNGWIKEVCSHMKMIGNRFRRGIYAFEFPDKSAYIGLTYSYEERLNYHTNQGYISKKLESMDAIFIEFNEFYSPKIAAQKEAQKISEYRKKGWKILNRAKAGSIGAKEKLWTKKSITKEALKYKTKKEFYKNNSSAYTLASKNGWLKNVCKHMDNSKRKKFGYWTKEKCIEVANKCKTVKEFNQKYRTASSKSSTKGWYAEITKHLKSYRARET